FAHDPHYTVDELFRASPCLCNTDRPRHSEYLSLWIYRFTGIGDARIISAWVRHGTRGVLCGKMVYPYPGKKLFHTRTSHLPGTPLEKCMADDVEQGPHLRG